MDETVYFYWKNFEIEFFGDIAIICKGDEQSSDTYSLPVISFIENIEEHLVF